MFILQLTTRLILILLSLILYIQLSPTAFAKENTLITNQELKDVGFSKYESINPNLLIFPVKRSVEDIKLALLFDKDSKAEYLYTLLDNRFKELVFIINFQKTGFLRETVDRYNSLIGVINYKDQNLKNKFLVYINVLKTLQDHYPNDSAYRLLIQEAMDSTRRLF